MIHHLRKHRQRMHWSFGESYTLPLSAQMYVIRAMHLLQISACAEQSNCVFWHPEQNKVWTVFCTGSCPSGSPDNTTNGLHLVCPPQNQAKSQLKVPGSSYNSALHHVLSNLLMITLAVSCHYIILRITSGADHPSPFSAKVKDRVLHLWAFVACYRVNLYLYLITKQYPSVGMGKSNIWTIKGTECVTYIKKIHWFTIRTTGNFFKVFQISLIHDTLIL